MFNWKRESGILPSSKVDIKALELGMAWIGEMYMGMGLNENFDPNHLSWA
jgi:hypothetical protein